MGKRYALFVFTQKQTMSTTAIFTTILNAVCTETDISKDDILTDKKQTETVNARHILVHLLYKSGIYPRQIAKMINQTSRSVNYMLSKFSERVRNEKIMRMDCERIEKRLGSK